MTVMMFGMTGAGKSSLGNLIAGMSAFETGDNTSSVTNLDSVMRFAADDGSIVLLDTIGLGDTEIDQEKVVASIRDVALSAPNGVDVLLFVMRNSRITDDAIARLIYVTEYLWGHECLLNLYIVVTCAARYLSNWEAGKEWIQRQAEINWRFKHIYSIVGYNPHRFIFVDNPDAASGELNVEERHQASRNALMKTLAQHPRNVIPPFTSAMMKRAQELTKNQRTKLEEKEKEVERWQQELEQKAPKTPRDKKKRTPETQAEKAIEDEIEKNLTKAKEDKEAAKQEMDNKLIEVKADKEFHEEAVREGNLATMRFANQFQLAPMGRPEDDQGEKKDDSSQACRRMADKLTTRFSVSRRSKGEKDIGTDGETPVPKTPRIEEREHVLDQILARIRGKMDVSPTDTFGRLGGWEGAGAIQPSVFNSYLLAQESGITLQQVGGLWRRADTNCDGQLDLQEFRNLFGDN